MNYLAASSGVSVVTLILSAPRGGEYDPNKDLIKKGDKNDVLWPLL
jgi:hypothetical protein